MKRLNKTSAALCVCSCLHLRHLETPLLTLSPTSSLSLELLTLLKELYMSLYWPVLFPLRILPLSAFYFQSWQCAPLPPPSSPWVHWTWINSAQCSPWQRGPQSVTPPARGTTVLLCHCHIWVCHAQTPKEGSKNIVCVCARACTYTRKHAFYVYSESTSWCMAACDLFERANSEFAFQPCCMHMYHPLFRSVWVGGCVCVCVFSFPQELFKIRCAALCPWLSKQLPLVAAEDYVSRAAWSQLGGSPWTHSSSGSFGNLKFAFWGKKMESLENVEVTFLEVTRRWRGEQCLSKNGESALMNIRVETPRNVAVFTFVLDVRDLALHLSEGMVTWFFSCWSHFLWVHKKSTQIHFVLF